MQIGGWEAYEMIRANNENRTSPKGRFKAVLDTCKPALVLLDELADDCVSASGVNVEASNLSYQTVSFMQELTEALAGSIHCVLIATLPASAQELAASPVSPQILTALENRLIRVGANPRLIGICNSAYFKKVLAELQMPLSCMVLNFLFTICKQ